MKHPERWAREFSRTWQGIEDFWKPSSGWSGLGRWGSCGGESHVGIMGSNSLRCMKNCPPLPESDQRGFRLDCSSECRKGPLILPVTWNYLVPRAKKLKPTLSSFQAHMLELFLFTPLCSLPFHHLPLHIPPRKAYFWMDRMEVKRQGLWNGGAGAVVFNQWRAGNPFPLTSPQAVFPGLGTDGQAPFMEAKRERVVSGWKFLLPEFGFAM